MINVSENILDMLGRPARRIQARVELYECSTLQNGDYNRVLLDTFPSSGALQELKVERTADDGKFFGFGICQKLTVRLRDKDRAINISKDQILEISFGVEGSYTYPCPLFRIEEVTRNENNNELTIIAYDFIYKAGEHRVSELGLTDYSMRNFVYACADVLNLPVKFSVEETAFDTVYPEGANFDGSETLREALNAVADATQTIFFVDWDWRLTFKRLDKDAEPVLHIDKSKYFELKDKSDKTLTTICHATELGDNVEASTGEPGVTQYVRNNPFWDLRYDLDEILPHALAAIAGITISQFDCSWRGNFALEIGDKFTMTTKDNQTLVGYLLNDTITYNGGLREQTFWNFTEHNAETAANPISLGEALKQTYAKIDKANRTITLYASETNAKIDEHIKDIEEREASIKVTVDDITSRVERTETLTITNKAEMDNAISDLDEEVKEQLGEIDAELLVIQSSIESKMSADEFNIEINKVVEAGAIKVETTTGYKFDDEGLNIAKSGSEMSTTITEDGMTVYRSGDAVLIANNEGVYAEDLHATTYLIIGKNSRFEDYGGNRTGCFWIGG